MSSEPRTPGDRPAPAPEPATDPSAPSRRPEGPATDDDGYPEALASIQSHFARAAAAGPLFTTDSGDLFTLFLDTLPPALRQHYTCHACRDFFRRYAGLVAVADGATVPVMWSHEPQSGPLADALLALQAAVARAPISGVFLTGEATWGTPQTGPWQHFAVRPARALLTPPSLVKTPGQLMAEKREDRTLLERGLAEFGPEVVRKAHVLLTSGQLARSDRHLGASKWLLELHEKLAAAVGRARDNLLWLAAAQAPAGFCHIRSGMLGTLLADVAAELPFSQIKTRFEDKMDPTQYMRAQAAPSAGQIAQAEKIVAALNAAGALERRYARLDDVQEFVWRPQAAPQSASQSPSQSAGAGGVFAHLRSQPRAKTELPRQTLTFEKFRRTVLPGAVTIELQVPGSSGHFMALVTAARPEAPPILQWDGEERRNPVSWYYHSGVDAEIRERVRAAGGMHEGVDIRASLLWNNRNDLDLHVITPRGEHVYFGSKRASCGGWLDVDMNVRGETTKPVENIRWARGAARRGHYRVYVQNYRFHEHAQGPTPFKVELEVNGQISHFEGVMPAGRTGAASDFQVFEFDYDPAQPISLSARPQHQSDAQQWNLQPGAWAPLTGITLSPNHWGGRSLEQHGKHAFFLIKGCRDLTAAEKRGRGFFVESLRSEFYPIRATLEAYAREAALAGAHEAEACGLGLSDQKQSWNLLLRVSTSDSVGTYLIDRWD